MPPRSSSTVAACRAGAASREYQRGRCPSATGASTQHSDYRRTSRCAARTAPDLQARQPRPVTDHGDPMATAGPGSRRSPPSSYSKSLGCRRSQTGGLKAWSARETPERHHAGNVPRNVPATSQALPETTHVGKHEKRIPSVRCGSTEGVCPGAAAAEANALSNRATGASPPAPGVVGVTDGNRTHNPWSHSPVL